MGFEGEMGIYCSIFPSSSWFLLLWAIMEGGEHVVCYVPTGLWWEFTKPQKARAQVPMVECMWKNIQPLPLALLSGVRRRVLQKNRTLTTLPFFPSWKSLNIFLSLSPMWFSPVDLTLDRALDPSSALSPGSQPPRPCLLTAPLRSRLEPLQPFST